MEQKHRELFEKLGMEFPAVAVRFHFERPEEVEYNERVASFCEFLKEAQATNKRFYIAECNDNCGGKAVLGMVPKSPFEAAGLVGVGHQIYRTPAPNARLHNTYPTLSPGSVNYVEFCPVAQCDFHPDLVICVADIEQAFILMRATSYISGDLWETKTSCVVSCAWTYVYPYLTGKVNYNITGMHLGMIRRNLYPSGKMIISIPYQKLDEVLLALEEMPWTPLSLREDEESKRKFAEVQSKWQRW